jgi:hypothetical protein
MPAPLSGDLAMKLSFAAELGTILAAPIVGVDYFSKSKC